MILLNRHHTNYTEHIKYAFLQPFVINEKQTFHPLPTHSHLSHRAQAPLKLQLGDTLVGGLAHLMTLVYFPLPATSAHTNAIDDISLLGFITKTSGFIRSGRTRGSMNSIQLTKLPTTNSQQEPK